MAVQCGSPSTHWQKVQSSSFHCSSCARNLLFTQQLALVLSIDSNSTSERKDRDSDEEEENLGSDSSPSHTVWFGYHEQNLNPKLKSSASRTTYSNHRVKAGLKGEGYPIRSYKEIRTRSHQELWREDCCIMMTCSHLQVGRGPWLRNNKIHMDLNSTRL